MPYANINDMKIYYEEYAPENTETILFLHGFTLDHRLWIADAEYLSQFYHVIIIDMKGHGKSDAPETGYSRSHRVEDVINFMDALNLDKVHLVGLSYGGTTGIGVALKYPQRLHTLTLAATAAAGYQAGAKISKIDKLFKEKGIEAGKNKWIQTALMWYKDDKKEIKKLMTDMMTEHSYIPWLDPRRGKYPREYDIDRVSNIKTPVLIVIGELDKIFLPIAVKLNQLIPVSTLKTYEKVGHMVNLEAPQKFQKDILEFIIANTAS